MSGTVGTTHVERSTENGLEHNEQILRKCEKTVKQLTFRFFGRRKRVQNIPYIKQNLFKV